MNRLHKWLLQLCVALALGGLLVACGGEQAASPTAAPTTAPAGQEPPPPPPGEEPPAPGGAAEEGAIPVFPDAQVLPADSPITELLSTLSDEAGTEGELEANAYTLPGSVTFDQVKEFYGNELTGRGWTEATGDEFIPQEDIPGGGAAAWSMGDNEAFAIIMMEDPLAGDRQILMTMRGTQN